MIWPDKLTRASYSNGIKVWTENSTMAHHITLQQWNLKYHSLHKIRTVSGTISMTFNSASQPKHEQIPCHLFATATMEACLFILLWNYTNSTAKYKQACKIKLLQKITPIR